MVSCSKCGKGVGCGCNLIDGLCTSCYSAKVTNNQTTIQTRSTERIRYDNTPEPPPNTEFDTILNIQSISKEEKIRRINEILEKAKEQYGNS
jgi:NMD protein affecting ribosome stability and mRNA decay